MTRRILIKKSDYFSICFLIAATLLLVFSSSVPVYSREAAGAEAELQKAMGQDYNLRPETYKKLSFSPEAWKVGDIISAKPYAVVTQKSDQDEVAIRVWTGLFFRDKDDLTVIWDEMWVDANGAVTNAHAEIDEYLPGYFLAASHKLYLVREFSGKMPWVMIPTDAEAKAGGWQPVPGEGLVNCYHIQFTEWEPQVADSSQTRIEETQAMPAAVPLIQPFVKNEAVVIPGDVAGHWAEEYMVDLLQKEIINGYDDHTIRPQLTVSRAEFVTLLVRGVGKGELQTAAKGYQDVENHWSGAWIGAAQAAGFLDTKPQAPSFRPDVPITRMEMVELISRACDKFHLQSTQEALTFTDTAELSASRQTSLTKAVGAGLIGGYPDGTFRSEGTLTRAEAFKVLSGLISLLQQ